MVPGGSSNKKLNGTGRWENITIHVTPGDGSYFQNAMMMCTHCEDDCPSSN